MTTRDGISLDRIAERFTRGLARATSRRGMLARVGTWLVGAAALPLLPVARGQAALPPDSSIDGDAGDPTSCNYWRNCAIDGFLCACCGGTANSCPPGTEMSPITWIGTCRNPADGQDYVVSYNDCCGSTLCMRCQCLRTEGEKPPYVMYKSNSLLWCFGTKSRAVHCSVSVVLGVAK
jgi:methylamine dehydrogenase light chain